MHWRDFHSSAQHQEFVKSRQFASSWWCDQEAVPIPQPGMRTSLPCQGSLSILLAPAAPGLPLTCPARGIANPARCSSRAVGHRYCPSPCASGSPHLHPTPSWAQLCWVPTPWRMLCVDGLLREAFGEQSELVASQKQGERTGKGQGNPGSPGWQLGTALLGVCMCVCVCVWGCLSLHWLQGEPRDRAKPGCACDPWMKVGKADGDDVLPQGPADGSGDSWGKAAKSRGFLGFLGETGSAASQHPGGCPHWSREPGAHPSHLLPPCPESRASPPWQEDVPVPSSCCVWVFSTGPGLLVILGVPKMQGRILTLLSSSSLIQQVLSALSAAKRDPKRGD